jgi:hypothetical protein
MTVSRIKPKIGKTRSREFYPKPEKDDPMGCVWMLINIGIWYFILSAITDVLFKTASKLDQIVCLGTLIFFVAISVGPMVLENQARKSWMKGCITAQATILKRDGKTWISYRGRYHSSFWLELALNPHQRAVSQGETIVHLEVEEDIYNGLANSDTVRIYYQPTFPLTFLLEDELKWISSI